MTDISDITNSLSRFHAICLSYLFLVFNGFVFLLISIASLVIALSSMLTPASIHICIFWLSGSPSPGIAIAIPASMFIQKVFDLNIVFVMVFYVYKQVFKFVYVREMFI